MINQKNHGLWPFCGIWPKDGAWRIRGGTQHGGFTQKRQAPCVSASVMPQRMIVDSRAAARWEIFLAAFPVTHRRR